jgi:hypothetical protein
VVTPPNFNDATLALLGIGFGYISQGSSDPTACYQSWAEVRPPVHESRVVFMQPLWTLRVLTAH